MKKLASLSLDVAQQKSDGHGMNSKKLQPLDSLRQHSIELVFTDIDGTLTNGHSLPGNSYQALWDLKNQGFKIIPVTGRPAGWCEMIARTWPVEGVIGENGALYFSLKQGEMKRVFALEEEQRLVNQEKLKKLAPEILRKVPGSAIASDQFARLFDLAIDFCEDVEPLPQTDILKIYQEFLTAGAVAKISNIHVNGWFGSFDKKTMAEVVTQNEYGWSEEEAQSKACFVGDSPNDEPMFAWLYWSFGVANIKDYQDQLKALPRFVSLAPSANGFVEIAQALIASKKD